MIISEFMQNAFDQMVEGILFIDTEGVVIYANTAYLKFIRLTAEEFIGYSLRSFRPHARLPGVVKKGKKVLHAQRLEDLDEAYFVNMYPVYEDGEIVGGVSVITFMDEAQRARIELNNFEKNNRQLLKQINQQGKQFTFDKIIAVDPVSVKIKAYAERLAEGEMTILLESESGTGKEVYAQAIHHAGPRKNGVFLAVNCAGFNKEILDSELFGYEDGAFTGAKKGGKIGLFEAANGGTLFLDEISEMDITLQAKLLRVLQEHKIRPVGSTKEYDVDVRIICACNADLEMQVERGLFRMDLFYRLNVFPVRIPPLRKRREDIPALVRLILKEISEKYRRMLTISQAAMGCLATYNWPGNVRELRNVVEFAAYLCSDDHIEVNALPEQIRNNGLGEPAENLTLSQRVRTFEKNEIKRLLSFYGDTLAGKKKTASALNISLASLYNKLK